jgi:hypothetical protein
MKTIIKVTLLAATIISSTITHAEKFQFVVKEKPKVDAKSHINKSVKNTSRISTISIKADSLEEAYEMARKSGDFEAVELDIMINTNSKPKILGRMTKAQSSDDSLLNDPYLSEQTYWNEQNTTWQTAAANNVLAARKIQVPYAPIRVGIIDGGFYNDFQDNIAKGGVSLINEPEQGQNIGDTHISPEEDRFCETGHGTGIMGIIGATIDDAYGMAGIADVDIYAVRALRCGNGRLSDAAKGIRYLIGESVEGIPVIDRPVHIINISLGAHVESGGIPFYMQDAIDSANNAGVTVIAAGGNFNRNSDTFFPAAGNGVISVSAIDAGTGDKFDTSNYGDSIDIGAQGSFVASYNTSNPEQVGYWDETSFATAIVSGIYALAYQAAPNLEHTKLEEIMKLTSNKFENSPECDLRGCGAGVLNAKSFVDALFAYESGDFGTIKHLLNTSEFCDKTVYLASNNIKARLCDSYLVNLNVAYNATAVYQVSKGEPLELSNAELVAEVVGTSFILASLDLDNFDYAYRACKDDMCDTATLLPLNSTLEPKPTACN